MRLHLQTNKQEYMAMSNENSNIIGLNISAARKARGLTQAQVAERMGIPYQSIGQWERGIRTPRLKSLEKIANAIGCTVQELIGKNLSYASGSKAHKAFSDREHELIEAYRKLSPASQNLLVEIAKTFIREM